MARGGAKVTVIGSRKNPFFQIRHEFEKYGIEEAREALFDEGERLAAMIQLNIFQQSLPMPDLSEPYLAFKERKGYDLRKLIAEGHYIEAIQARWIRGRTAVEVGLPDETHEASGLKYKKLAAVHEYGQKSWQDGQGGIPARPHWRPTFRQWARKIDDVTEVIQHRVTEKLWKRLNRKFGQYKKKL